MPNDVDKRFDEKYPYSLWMNTSPIAEMRQDTKGLTFIGMDVKAFIHAELKNQAKDLLEILKSSNDIPDAITRIENKITETKY